MGRPLRPMVAGGPNGLSQRSSLRFLRSGLLAFLAPSLPPRTKLRKIFIRLELGVDQLCPDQRVAAPNGLWFIRSLGTSEVIAGPV